MAGADHDSGTANIPSGLTFHRVRIVLRLRQPTALPPYHAGVIYALLAVAHNRGSAKPPAIPDGLMLDVVEQCRVQLDAGDLYAFGFSLIGTGATSASRCACSVVDGLARLGREGPTRSGGFGGNFDIESVEDLIGGRPLQDPCPLEAVPASHIAAEIQRVRAMPQVTLHFRSPLRLERPGQCSAAGHRFLDREYFDVAYFLDRLQSRLDRLGVSCPLCPSSTAGIRRARIVDNRLVWLDFGWGRDQVRKTLGGAMGRVMLAADDPAAADLLVWGQYARCGKNTRFGFGAYRIEELGDDPFECRRAAGLLDLAFQSSSLDRAAVAYSIPSGEVRAAARRALLPNYVPANPTRISIPAANGCPRELAIPSRLDRALQRAVLEQLSPAIDQFLDGSAIAWRRGLGRSRAPYLIEKAYRDGFRFAMREDFRRFFDSVDHQEIIDRLSAYVGDRAMTDLIARWIASGAAASGKGLPTGAPLSPLLGNLLLDEFDERIKTQGAQLVRYGDDCFVLFRDRDQGEALHRAAEAAAAKLRLQLNERKSALLDLAEPFEFLGFRFEPGQRWEITQSNNLRLVDELSWHDASRSPRPGRERVSLPGECHEDTSAEAATIIIGPRLQSLAVEAGRMTVLADGRPPRQLPIDRIRQLIITTVPLKVE